MCGKGGSARTANQLGVKLIQLHSAPSTKDLIAKSLEYLKDPDRSSVRNVRLSKTLAELSLSAIPALLGQNPEGRLSKIGYADGDYELYASKTENRFVDPPLIALEEYGIPLETGLKLRRYLRPYSNIDDVIGKLRGLPLEKTNLSGFEMEITRQAQTSI